MTKTQSRTPTELGWLCGFSALLFMALVLSACNTVEGMGES